MVDGFLPCVPFGRPVFGDCYTNELWVGLLEKVFAKKRGSYAALRSGSSRSALVDLTGCPVVTLRVAPAEKGTAELFDQIESYLGNGCVATCGTGELADEELGSRHAFVLSQVRCKGSDCSIGRAL